MTPSTAIPLAATPVGGHVQSARIWQRHADMAAIGGIHAEGNPDVKGVCRQAFTAEDREARRLLIDWAVARGFLLEVDDIGNLFVRRPGQDNDAPAVLTGSHMDSQPQGGRFDGIFGVLAGLEALEAIDDAGVMTRRAIELVAWSNEEGGRFQPGAMGSRVHCGVDSLEGYLDVRDLNGTKLSDALAETLADSYAHVTNRHPNHNISHRAFRLPYHAYIEAHIEQGPLLEAAGKSIGVVTGVQGVRWFQVSIVGETCHAGTTPLRQRRDAVQGAIRTISALNDLMYDPEDILRYTVAHMVVTPNAPSSVASKVDFVVDFRHPSADILREHGDRVAPLAAESAAPCTSEVNDFKRVEPCVFPDAIVDLVEAAANLNGTENMRLLSGAFHDACYMHGVCPTGMIFIPCEKGISHNEAENASEADVAAGASVLADSLLALANQP